MANHSGDSRLDEAASTSVRLEPSKSASEIAILERKLPAHNRVKGVTISTFVFLRRAQKKTSITHCLSIIPPVSLRRGSQ
jgi:hypothetical protein